MFPHGIHSALPRAFGAVPQMFDCALNDPYGVHSDVVKTQTAATPRTSILSAYRYFFYYRSYAKRRVWIRAISYATKKRTVETVRFLYSLITQLLLLREPQLLFLQQLLLS